MKTIGKTGIVMTALLSLLLVVGCAEPDKYLTLDLGGGVTMKLVRIEAGKFTMGSPETEEDRSKAEGPQHQVAITRPFYMGATEVTQSQFKAVMSTQPWDALTYAKAGGVDDAASYITWDEATAFCAALSKKTGRTVRLPTEAEWEYACRAGTTTVYSFGDEASKLGDYAWYNDNARDKDEKYPHPVSAKKPNAWGLYDMHGNVWEWCDDWYADSYANADTRDPKGAADGKCRVLRGGSWGGVPRGCRAASRGWCAPDGRGYDSGFRVVIESGFGVNRTIPVRPELTIQPAKKGQLSLGGDTVADHAVAGFVVGTLQGSSPGGTTLTYRLTDDAGGRFMIRGRNLVVAPIRRDINQTVQFRVERGSKKLYVQLKEGPQIVKLSQSQYERAKAQGWLGNGNQSNNFPREK